MVEQYVQTVEVNVPQSLKTKHILGTIVELLALGLILVAVFYSYYVFIAVGVFLAVGIALNQAYNSSAKEYEYAFNTVRLIISRQNQLGKRVRKLELLLSDVKSYGTFRDIVNKEDLVFCADIQAPNVKEMCFDVDGVSHRIIFQPDDYLFALLEEVLGATLQTEQNTNK